VKDVARDLLSAQDSISAGDVARASGVTRQAAYYHLADMVRSGELARTGAKRGTRYHRRASFVRRYELDGLEEDRAWLDVRDKIPRLSVAAPNVQAILAYAFTEMLNNAIEHSRGKVATVRVVIEQDQFVFEVADDGVGVFRTVRERFGLRDDFESIQHLSKGKQTTQPDRHSGEGIFFTSKAVDVFILESGGLRWSVDNLRRDQAIGDIPTVKGTRVRWRLAERSPRRLQEVFEESADPQSLRFARSSVLVKLGERGDLFVSRSEAKRLSIGLEAFDEVALDFSDVTEVGQGFVDELFRVWAREHPTTRLVPVNMSPAVAAMVERGIPRAEGL
jgi:anti-sigma regulatory factor (Ser/Thr protein kinase)